MRKSALHLDIGVYLLDFSCHSDKGAQITAQEPYLAGPEPSSSSPSIVLPPWEEILPLAELYLLYCDSQPLPLFHRGNFVASLQTRDVEIIYTVLALSLRFSDHSRQSTDNSNNLVNGYAEVARGLVMKRVSEGPVELSTLQCLCLLSLVDFTSKYFSLVIS